MNTITVGSTTYNIEWWLPGQPVLFGPFLAIDTETEKLVVGRPVVPVLMQVCSQQQNRIHLIHAEHHQQYLTALEKLSPQPEFVFHNAPFDLLVLDLFNSPYLIRKTENKEIIDIGIRFILRQLSLGELADKWSLGLISRLLLGIELTKEADVRLSFRQGMTFDQEQLEYAATDSAVTAQIRDCLPNAFKTEYYQLVGFIALTVISRNGLLVDRRYFKEIKAQLQKEHEEAMRITEWWNYRPGSTGNLKILQEVLERIVEKYSGQKLPRTPKTNRVQTTDEAIAEIKLDRPFPFLTAYKTMKHAEKMMVTYLKEDLIGEDGRVHSFFSPLVKTGRTSSSKPNIQNIPRKEGLRGIYIAPPEHVLFACDYKQLELCALAESCLVWYGQSVMAEILNSGVDLHNWFAAKVTGKEIGQVSKVERQMAKAVNFGIPGGLGSQKLVVYAHVNYGVSLTLDRAVELRQLWLDSFPEMKYHLRPPEDPGNFDEEGNPLYLARTIYGRVRRKASYCSACNYVFQGLAADGARIALWFLIRNGFKVVNFVHDETITELPNDNQLQERTKQIGQLMIKGMRLLIKHVNISVEGALMRRWYKEAEPVFDENNNLLIWTPETDKTI